MLVTSNTFTDVEYGAFTLINGGGVFDADLDGLQISDNTVTQHGLDHFVTVEADLGGHPGARAVRQHLRRQPLRLVLREVLVRVPGHGRLDERTRDGGRDPGRDRKHLQLLVR